MKFKNLLTHETVPDKSFFKPAEVSALLRVKPHEIRYWESEFSGFKAHKTKNGLKLYRRDDVILFSAIRHLLHEKKFTIPGAKQILKDANDLSGATDTPKPVAPAPVVDEPTFHHAAPVALACSEVLHEAAEILASQTIAFDETHHELYQECGEELAEPTVALDMQEAQEIIKTGIQNIHNPPVSNDHLIQAVQQKKSEITLLASKESLEEVLDSLDRFQESPFWKETFKA
jgi:DNA-binding transcriptional MerR regulator